MDMVFETTDEIDQTSALWNAVANNNQNAIVNLLKEGANTEYSGEYRGENLGCTPLQMAVRMGRFSMVKKLLEFKANIHVRSDIIGETLLHEAVEWLESYKAFSMVRILVENGAVVDATDYAGFTALHKAARKGNCFVVDFLIEKKADVMLQTCDGQTALEIVSAIDTSKLSAPRIRFTTKTKESIELEMERSEQAKQRIVAFAMGQHKRLGQFSEVLTLHPELVRMML